MAEGVFLGMVVGSRLTTCSGDFDAHHIFANLP